jgi:hypothetical protein
MNRSSSSSVVQKPALIRSALTAGRVRAMANCASLELVERGLRLPAPDPEADEPGHSIARREQLDTLDARQRVGGDMRHLRTAPVDEVEPDVHRQPAKRASHAQDRRAVVVRDLEPLRVGRQRPIAAGVARREGEEARERRLEPVEELAPDPQGAQPLRPEQPLLRRDRVHVDAEIAHGDWNGARRLCPVDEDERTALVGDVGDAADRHHEARGPQDVRDRHQLRAGRDQAIEKADDLVVGCVARELGEGEIDPRIGRRPCTAARSRRDARGRC